MVFLGYPKCSTSNKAQKWLDENNIEYTFRHIKDNNPTADEIEKWINQSGLEIKKFFNTSGLIYKDMGLKDKLPTMSDEEKITLLSTNGMLVKRPMLIDEEKNIILVGFKEAQWKEKLK